MFEVELTAIALRHYKALAQPDRSRLRTSLRIYLADGDPRVETRNRFRLRRASPHADFELRIEDLRVFYRVDAESRLVVVTLIGRKQGSKLIIEGQEFKI